MASKENSAAKALEAGLIKPSSIGRGLTKNMSYNNSRTAHNMSAASLRRKSDRTLISNVRWKILRNMLANLQEVFLGTKLFFLFPAVPLAMFAQSSGFGCAWIFTISLLGLIPLAERVDFLTEQIAFYTSPIVGGLLNATCENATELIIALFALYKGKIDVVKFSLIGSILSNLLLVLGTSLFFGGITNLRMMQTFDRKQPNVNTSLLMLSALCHVIPLMFRHAMSSAENNVTSYSVLTLSRICSICMLVAYIAYLFFELKTHRQLFDLLEEDDDNDDVMFEDEAVLGFPSALAWLVGMTIIIAILSEYVVGTIEAASASWGLSISFTSIILLPIAGNAAEHAGAIIFALKNKLDITLKVSLGSATQFSMFVVPLSVILAWIMGIRMDLDFRLLETGALFISILITSFVLQDGSSNYLKGFVLFLSYIVIGACFFVLGSPPGKGDGVSVHGIPATFNIAEA